MSDHDPHPAGPSRPDPADTSRPADAALNNGRRETPLERADRNFTELLQELRVTQTGVQILFAFLLTLAFTPRFPSLDTVQRATYVTTLLLAVLAAALFTAPAAVHRGLFQRGAKPLIVRVSSRLAGAGLSVLVLALTGSVLLVVDVAATRTGAVFAAAGTLVACGGLWWLLPRAVARAGERAGEVRPADDGDADNDGDGGRDRAPGSGGRSDGLT
ncbi:DUF6328 family protein [Streptomyces aurantiacus]|uniref:Uncharacterized protein n=1 Tax=Streptomyces aurantiacus JA 4570 TaxID=1286094 RepID=S4AJQ8_9ACTN|nr:DUF6328 family protein [Streptomyces aurantiacus]EPH41717.1 hypothetical protein STRAU_5208 [Streptomyces aurantiacus JA 4570]